MKNFDQLRNSKEYLDASGEGKVNMVGDLIKEHIAKYSIRNGREQGELFGKELQARATELGAYEIGEEGLGSLAGEVATSYGRAARDIVPAAIPGTLRLLDQNLGFAGAILESNYGRGDPPWLTESMGGALKWMGDQFGAMRETGWASDIPRQTGEAFTGRFTKPSTWAGDPHQAALLLGENAPQFMAALFAHLGIRAAFMAGGAAVGAPTGPGMIATSAVAGQVGATAAMSWMAAANAHEELVNNGWDENSARTFNRAFAIGSLEGALEAIVPGMVSGKLAGRALKGLPTKRVKSLAGKFKKPTGPVLGTAASAIKYGFPELATEITQEVNSLVFTLPPGEQLETWSEFWKLLDDESGRLTSAGVAGAGMGAAAGIAVNFVEQARQNVIDKAADEQEKVYGHIQDVALAASQHRAAVRKQITDSWEVSKKDPAKKKIVDEWSTDPAKADIINRARRAKPLTPQEMAQVQQLSPHTQRELGLMGGWGPLEAEFEREAAEDKPVFPLLDSLSKEDAERITREAAEEIFPGTGYEVEVYETQYDIPDAIWDAHANGRPAPGIRVKGFHLGNTVHIVAGNVTESDIRGLWLHEVMHGATDSLLADPATREGTRASLINLFDEVVGSLGGEIKSDDVVARHENLVKRAGKEGGLIHEMYLRNAEAMRLGLLEDGASEEDARMHFQLEIALELASKLSAKIDLGTITEGEKTLWQKILAFIKRLWMGGSPADGLDDYSPAVREFLLSSLRALRDNIAEGTAKPSPGVSLSVTTPEADARLSVTDARYDNGPLPEGVQSTARPTAASRTHDFMERHLVVGMEAVDDVHKGKMAGFIRRNFPLPDKTGTDDELIQRAKDFIVSNLLYLHDLLSEEGQENSRKWYDGANSMAYGWAKLYDLEPVQTAAIIAANSPQTDWFVNVDRAKRILDTLTKHRDLKTTPQMMVWLNDPIRGDSAKKEEGRVASRERHAATARLLQGKTLGEVLDLGLLEDAAIFIRAANETGAILPDTRIEITPAKGKPGKYKKGDPEVVQGLAEVGDRRPPTIEMLQLVHEWSPDGVRGDLVRKKQTKQQKEDDLPGDPAKLTWASYDMTVKSIRAYLSPDNIDIDYAIGAQHKVRSFFSNIMYPLALYGDVTIDIHAGGGGMMNAFSTNDPIPQSLVSSGGAGGSNVTGLKGLYPLFADAFRAAAALRTRADGDVLLAREMQSITWESIRALISAPQKATITKDRKALLKAKSKEKVELDQIWEDYQNGNITQRQAQDRIFDAAEGQELPSYLESPGVEEGGEAVEPGSVGRADGPGTRRGDRRRIGEGDTGEGVRDRARPDTGGDYPVGETRLEDDDFSRGIGLTRKIFEWPERGDSDISLSVSDARFSIEAQLATTHSGIGTYEAALRDVKNVYAVEYDPKIAEQFNLSHGTNYEPMDIADLDPAEIAATNSDAFHASPSCTRFSSANRSVREALPLDRTSAQVIAKVIRQANPPAVTIENVPKYMKTKLFKLITNALIEMDYEWDIIRHNATDFGGRASRDRIYLRAVRRELLPPGAKLIEAAPVLDARLSPGKGLGKFGSRLHKDLPKYLEKHLYTVEPTEDRSGRWFDGVKDLIEDAPVLTPKAFKESRREKQDIRNLINKREVIGKNGKPLKSIDPALPIITMGASYPSARDASQYSETLTASESNNVKIIMPYVGDLSEREMKTFQPLMDEGRTAQTPAERRVVAKIRRRRAWIPGKVVRATPRMLARIMSLPDKFRVPGDVMEGEAKTELELADIRLAKKVLGNGMDGKAVAAILQGIIDLSVARKGRGFHGDFLDPTSPVRHKGISMSVSDAGTDVVTKKEVKAHMDLAKQALGIAIPKKGKKGRKGAWIKTMSAEAEEEKKAAAYRELQEIVDSVAKRRGVDLIPNTEEPRPLWRGFKIAPESDNFGSHIMSGRATVSMTPHKDVADMYSHVGRPSDSIRGMDFFQLEGAVVNRFYTKLKNPLDLSNLSVDVFLSEALEQFNVNLFPHEMGGPNAPVSDQWSALDLELLMSDFLARNYADWKEQGYDENAWGREVLAPNFKKMFDTLGVLQQRPWDYADDPTGEDYNEFLWEAVRSIELELYLVVDTNAFTNYAKRIGHDSIIHTDTVVGGVRDSGFELSSESVDIENDYASITYRPFYQNSMKLADPITYYEAGDRDVLAGEAKVGEVVPLDKRFGDQDGVHLSVSDAGTDAEYMKIAQDPEGIEDKPVQLGILKSMIESVARASGFTIRAWHGTHREFKETIFRTLGITNQLGTHFTSDPELFGPWETTYEHKEKVYEVFLKMENPLRLIDPMTWSLGEIAPQIDKMDFELDDLLGDYRTDLSFRKEVSEELRRMRMPEVADTIDRRDEDRVFEYEDSRFGAVQEAMQTVLINRGYDGIVYLNRAELRDRVVQPRGVMVSDERFLKKNPTATDSYIIFNPEHAKSADAITRYKRGDPEEVRNEVYPGEAIPPSKRFDVKRRDFRLSVEDADFHSKRRQLEASARGAKTPDLADWAEKGRATREAKDPGARLADPVNVPPNMPELEEWIDITDHLRQAYNLPGTVNAVEILKHIAPQIEKDPDKWRKKLIRSFDPLSPGDILAFRYLMAKDAMDAWENMDLEKIKDYILLANRYRQIGTATAQSLAFRRNNIMAPADKLKDLLAQGIFRTSKRHPPTTIGAPGWLDIELQKMEKTHAELKRNGINPSDILNYDINSNDDLIKLGIATRVIQTTKASWDDKFYEYWRGAGLLSAWTTQMANMVGNTGFTTWEFTAQKAADRMFGVEGSRLNEILPAWGAMIKGTAQAFKLAFLTYKTELPVFDFRLGVKPMSEFHLSPAIAGKKGRVFRWSFRVLLAADQAARYTVFNMQTMARAVRIATDEKLKGADWENRIKGILDDPFNEAIRTNLDQLSVGEEAIDKATMLTFQNEMGETAKTLSRFRDSKNFFLRWAARWHLPFLQTPLNIFKQSLRRSPFGILQLFSKTKRSQEGRRIMAEQFLSFGAMVTLMLLYDDEDDDGNKRMTGSRPFTFGEEERRRYRMDNAPPQSVRLGSKWVSYARLEPFATILTFIIDSLEVGEEAAAGKEAAEVISSAAGRFVGQWRDKTFLQGVGDLSSMLSGEKDVTQHSARFVSSWMPNIIRKGFSSRDDLVRDWRNRDVNLNYFEKAGIRAYQGMFPDPAIAPLPKRDWLGRVMERDKVFTQPAGDWAFRMISPVWTQEVDRPDDLAETIERGINIYNNKHPNTEFYPALIEFRKDKETVPEWHNRMELSGKRTLENLKYLGLDFDNLTEEDIGLIRKTITQSRSEVTRQLSGGSTQTRGRRSRRGTRGGRSRSRSR